ncbi:MAG TPA: ABC transporter ATP-binding protein [Myxococcales bacterium]|nr:ABC transporter ATP-binding protein [Myxococcales bacterium]
MTAPGLSVEALSVRRGGRAVLRDVSFSVSRGEIVAVIGPNGAGKSTLLEAILGELPSTGAIHFDGRPLRTLRERAPVLSWMPDQAEPPAEVEISALLALVRKHGRAPPALAAELEERLHLGPLRCARAGELSRGEKRRVLLFSALCTDRPVVVLDEPLGTFDPLQLLDVCEVLRARAASGAALLLSVHQMADAEKIAGRLLLLDQGEAVAFGALDQLRAQAGRPGAPLEQVFVELLRGRRSVAPA